MLLGIAIWYLLLQSILDKQKDLITTLEKVVRAAHDKKAQIKWFEDDTISTEPLDVLQLEVETPEKKKPKFQMYNKASSSTGNDVEFDTGDTALIVADNHNQEQENFTTTHDGATPVDSSTPAGEYFQLAI